MIDHLATALQQLWATLSSRERAWAFWTIVVILFFLAKRSLRQSFAGVLRTAFARVFVKVYLALGVYLAALVSILYHLGVWTYASTKDFFLWVLLVVLPLLFKVTKLRTPEMFKGRFWDAIKLTVVVEFVVAYYTFGFWIEFVLVPILVFVGLMQAMLSVKPETDPKGHAAKVLNGIVSVFVLIIVANAIYMFASAPYKLLTLQNLLNLTLPSIFTIYFLPFLYALSLYILYEGIYNRLPFIVKDEAVRKRVWRHILRVGNVRLGRVDRISYQIILVDTYTLGNARAVIEGISRIDNDLAAKGARWDD